MGFLINDELILKQKKKIGELIDISQESLDARL